MKNRVMLLLSMAVGVFAFQNILGLLYAMGNSPPEDFACEPTRRDALGPFYEPDAPVRSKVGEGYVLSGTVKSALDCSAIKRAKIEFWLTGPGGDYDDDHRATLYSDDSGRYRFESNPPPAYGRRPPHIHVRVSAEGFRTLITQHYPVAGKKEATQDLVLIP